MKQLSLVLLLAVSPLIGQSLYLDLSGEWRMLAEEDRSAFAEPGFDVNKWSKYVLPSGPETPPCAYGGPCSFPMALTLGVRRSR